ncbi:MAG: hypothetical protein PHE17_17620 [Thiothrix sp.]|uniref:hypothetical protein n=1 Tax=Thiothrix sp. TaxID=1032 RepID=UPI0026216D3F|nr:hypothetical protein [Thiothrix sp.]MDD5394840.1 hypothetical protein [Thiothrix sp.]
MKLNGITVHPKHKPKTKPVVQPNGHCRWESATGTGANVTLHRQKRLAIFRAAQLHGIVRAVTYLPDGIVQHGKWQRV